MDMPPLRYSASSRVVAERIILGAPFFLPGGIVAIAAGFALLILPLAALGFWCAVRHARLQVTADSDGLIVRNPWRSYYVPWREVAAIKPIITESKTPYLVPGVRRKTHVKAIRLWALASPTDRIIFKASEARPRATRRILDDWHRRFGVQVSSDW